MKYYHFSETELSRYPICLLVPTIQPKEIRKAYLDNREVDPNDIMVIDLHYAEVKKATKKADMKRYVIEELVPAINNINAQYILCADSEYFKILTGATKVDANLGYVLPCLFGSWNVFYVPNHAALFYDPEKIGAKIEQAMHGFISHTKGNYLPPGHNVLQYFQYPQTDTEIEIWLEKLLAMDKHLAIDIEAFSLKHHSAGIGTISFAWSKYEGIAFPVDYVAFAEPNEEGHYGKQVRNEHRRNLLRNFFIKFSKSAVYHSISFDVTVLIYQLFMKDIIDTEGLLNGLDIMLKDWHCTKLITYLATNSCSGNDLSLKTQAQEFAGNYAIEEIKDIRRIPLEKLLEYNLVDSCSTWFTYEKHVPTLVADDQSDIYENIFRPAILDIVQMQLTGLPVNMDTVNTVSDKLDKEQEDILAKLISNPVIEEFTYDLNQKLVDKKNAEYKKKRITIADVNEQFNPNSDVQVKDLLFNRLALPIINYTKNKQPSSDGESLEALLNHVTEGTPEHEVISLLIDWNIISVLVSNFIPSLKGAIKGPDNWHYLFGNFNLGGTLSGRLSSSGPNLQNLPSTGKGNPKKLKYAKLIKSCFQAPPGWLFCGVDFASLEDRISALTTKDPMKLKVYTDGYDGHSLRAYAYFGDQMQGIDGNSVESINSIAKLYKPLRDRSKNPTFTLTYQGTWIALVKKYKFTPEDAKALEIKYHELYKVSDDWVNTQLNAAMSTGYITAAFGLRLRTPLLKQVIRGTSKTPFEAEAEGRTAGNALGQSWCLLNTRAGIEFNAKVRKSRHRLDIRPCAQIHDAQYHLIRDEIGAIGFTNKHLIEAVKWQDHPDIWHDDVKLGGELSIFYPTWNDEICIPNDIPEKEIFAVIDKAMLERKSPK